MADRIARTRVDREKYRPVEADGWTAVPEHDDLLQFRTERATYHVHPGHHDRPTKLPAAVVGSVDALVVEEAFTRYERLSLDDLVATTQSRALLDLAFETAVPSVFLLDLPATTESVEQWAARARRRLLLLLGVSLLFLGLAWLWHPAAALVATAFAAPTVLLLSEAVARRLSLDRLADRPSRLRGLAVLPWWWTIYGGRSAVVAAKLETFVAPKLADERGRRPAILLDYGSLHLDVYYYLRFPRLRRLVLAVHDRRGWGPKDATYVDRVCEFVLTDVDEMFRNEMAERDLSYKQLVYELRGPDDP